jgi:uncharacterized protein
VLGAFAEPGADPGAVAPELADELRLLAGWLELERVSVARKGGPRREAGQSGRRAASWLDLASSRSTAV